MKPGSIVVVLPIKELGDFGPFVKWLPVQDAQTEYMVRTIKEDPDHCPFVFFEEGVIGHRNGNELGLCITCVKEILPPQNLTILFTKKEEYAEAYSGNQKTTKLVLSDEHRL